MPLRRHMKWMVQRSLRRMLTPQDLAVPTPKPTRRMEDTVVSIQWLKTHLRDSNVRIIDIRSPEEWTTLHIPGSMLVPSALLIAQLGVLHPPGMGEHLILVDSSGTTAAVALLRELGWPNARSLHEGFAAWLEEGGPTVPAPIRAEARFQIGDWYQFPDGQQGIVWNREEGQAKTRYRVLIPSTSISRDVCLESEQIP